MAEQEQGLCPMCQTTFAEGDEYASCKICSKSYHLECAGLMEPSPKFGCVLCYELPGIEPRRRIRTEPAPSAGFPDAEDNEDVDDERRRAVDTSTHLENGQSSTPLGQRVDGNNQGDRVEVQTTITDGVANNMANGQVTATESQQLMAMLRAQMDLIVQQTGLINNLASRGSSRNSSARASRTEQVRQWASNVNAARQADGTEEQGPVQVSSVPIARRPRQENVQFESTRHEDMTGRQASTRGTGENAGTNQQREETGRSDTHEDFALNVTRMNTSEEFVECLRTIKRGVPGVSNSPLYSRKPPELPKFSGGDLEWLEFIASYLESTQEYKVSDLANASRLRAALSGDPLKILNETMVFKSSLADAMDQLRITYGDPLRIIAALEREVLRADPIDEQGRNLQKLLIKTKRLINYIEACGYEDLLSSRSLLNKLQEKLPLFLALRWGDRLYGRRGIPSLKQFSMYLSAEFETSLLAGKTQVRMVTEGKTTAKKMVMTAVHVEESTAEQKSPTRTAPVNASAPPVCTMCKGGHRLHSCPTFEAANEDTRWALVQREKLCWQCLRPHQRRQCRVNTQCGVDNCTVRHHRLLHNKLKTKAVFTAQGGDSVLFKILPVKLHAEGQTIDTFCFFDEGSSVSMIDASLADALGLSGRTESLTITWTNGKKQTDRNSKRVSFMISGADGQNYRVNDVRTMKELVLPEQSLAEDDVRKVFGDDAGPEPFARARPRLLLGLRHVELGAPKEVRENSLSGTYAFRTKLGWLMYGGGTGSSGVVGMSFRVCHANHSREPELEEKIKVFYDLDSFGVRAAPHRLGAEEQRALDVLKRTTRKVGDRYETGLLWNEEVPKLPESRGMCLQRAKGLQLRMAKDPELGDKLQELVESYVRKGYCTDVTGVPPKDPCWYLPVFPVIKPGKVRLVFDAAAKSSDGRSLNSFLLSGPDMLNPLPEVIMRFREKRVGVSADVCEMFHQVRIRAQDRDAQRFLWWPPGAKSPRELRLDVMTFGATCSPAAAQFVQRQNASLFQDKRAAVKEILSNYYVDDQLSSYHTVQDAISVMNDVVAIQAHAGFELKKIRSSDSGVLSALSAEQQAVKELQSDKGSVLGMGWDCVLDRLKFSVHNAVKLRDTVTLTRRKMLSGTMSLFDPLGLAANVVVKAKMLIKLCLGLEWDEEVSPELKAQWQNWCDCLLQLKAVPIPRWLGICPRSTWQLHTFVDASAEAYAAATYMRGLSPAGEIVCSLVMAKTRVAPARATTIPRMELMAAVLGARLADTVKKASAMTISSASYWSDSMDCLCWVRSSHRRYHPFVAARVNEILELSAEEDWRWVPTRDNVADDATRFDAPIDSEKWLRGPEFLYRDESQWPITPGRIGTPKEELLPSLSMTIVNVGLVPDPGRFSSWSRMRNATAYALRLFLRGQVRHSGLRLDPDELVRAEEELWRAAQVAEYADVIRNLRADADYCTVKGHQLHRVCPTMDQKGVLRVNGRLPATMYSDEVRQPIILPANSRITELLVMHMHQKFLHGHHGSVVNEIRRTFYIPGLRRLVKKITSGCQTCRMRRPRIEPPRQGPLPPARAAVGWKSFSYCGLDYFGPFEVVVGRRREKRWGALFTCMTTRAVHIEIAHSLNMESCIMSVRTFCARRDVVPVEMRSDCGTNFVASAKELQKVADRFPTMRWVFNPPGAPHMGGAWERMVRAIKRCLHEVIGDRPLTDEVLRCALVEAEWVVNQHPLTHVSLDSDEEPALTPNDFLYGAKQQRDRQEMVLVAEEGTILRKSWRLAQQIADHFWKRFEREMLPILNLPTKWFKRGEPLQVGDLVMIADDARRGAWRRGRVTEVLKGKRDDQVRQVRMHTATGTVTRPVVKVAKLDVLSARE